MSRNKPTITSVLVDVTKWSGKWSFTFFILSLVLIAVSVSLADPNGAVHYISDENGNKFATYATFSLSGDDTVQLMMERVSGGTFEYRLEKIEYKSPENNVTNDFRNTNEDIEVYNLIIAVNDFNLYRNENLERGDYRIQVKANAGDEVFLGYAHFELGLISASVVLLVIFSVVFSIFNMVWPFALCALLISAFIPDEKSYKKSHPSSQPPTEQFQPVQQVEESEQQAKPSPSKVSSQPSDPRTSAEILTGTPLEHLKKNDWIGVGVAFVFLILFFVEPNGPFFFLFLITLFIVGYNVTEREKLKDRLVVLIRMYPKTTLKFLSQQLDKKEKDVTSVLRYMILDDAYPIRLDLVNKTVEKIGVFPEETIKKTSAEVTSRPVSVQVPISEETEQTQIEQETEKPEFQVEASQPTLGEINEPAAYCSACGEPLMQETKYCYHCGARQ